MSYYPDLHAIQSLAARGDANLAPVYRDVAFFFCHRLDSAEAVQVGG